MKRIAWILALALTLPMVAKAEGSGDGLTVLSELGRANGVALACHQTDNARHIKQLVIELAPRSRAWGGQFEEGTNQGFLEHHKAGAQCPAPEALAARVSEIEARLRSALKPS